MVKKKKDVSEKMSENDSGMLHALRLFQGLLNNM